MTSRDSAQQATLDRLMREHGLFGDTRLYREALQSDLQPAGEPGLFRLAANARPAESVVDVYGQGYVVQAEQVGPGLAFAQSDAPNWQETMEMRALKAAKGPARSAAADRVEVEVLLHDVLRQGGLLYPVESVTVERAWYCTLPEGGVLVRVAG